MVQAITRIMKTYNKLYEKLCSLENLYSAYEKAVKGKLGPDVWEFKNKLDDNIFGLQQELINKTYKPKPLESFVVRDPKTRNISKSDFKDRVVHHSIVDRLNPIFDSMFIYDSYASRIGKGHHKALDRFIFFSRKASKNGKKLKGIKDNNYVCGYCLKADIKHYFDTVDKDILINIIKRRVKDDDFINLIKIILNNFEIENGKGMPLGNYTSQFFANIYLNKLDYYAKHELKIKYYIRYVDDIIILHNSKEILEDYLKKINLFLNERLKIELHPDKSKIIPLHKGIKALGFKNFYYYRLLKKSNVNQMRRKMKLWKDQYENGVVPYETLIARLEGWMENARHGNTYKLRKKIVAEFNEYFIKK